MAKTEKPLPENIKEILELSRVRDIIESIKAVHLENKALMASSKGARLVIKKEINITATRGGPKATYGYDPKKIIKICMNEEVYEKYEIFCLAKGFTPSDFFIDLIYVIDELDEYISLYPDKTLKDLISGSSILKKLLGM